MPPKKRVKLCSAAAEAMKKVRAKEPSNEREERLAADRAATSARRAAETPEQREARLADKLASTSLCRAAETPDQREARLAADRASTSASRRKKQEQWANKQQAAFHYDHRIDYEHDQDVIIGKMEYTCKHCKAMKWKGEAAGMCCSKGKVRLPLIAEPPEPLKSLLSATSPDSKHFLKHIRAYNNCYQMTSFGATRQVHEPGYMPTFKVQGQVYHLAGSLLPAEDDSSKANPQFLQIYFMGDDLAEANQRSGHYPAVKQHIVLALQEMLHNNNQYVKGFKTAIEQLTSDDLRVVIREDKAPPGQHPRLFNAPATNEVAVIMVGDPSLQKRDILLHKRDNALLRIPDTHRSYDPLQYPLLFCQGQDGYSFYLKQVNPRTGQEKTKKVTANQFYAYHLMLRDTTSNHLLRCNQLCHQFVVDMYAKIESERLWFYRLNQSQLRVESYTELRDALSVDGNTSNVGKMVILPSSHTGSPRYLHEYVQDAMCYVRNYGKPDLFITYTCNPQWSEIAAELMPGQVPHDRHDLLARVFNQKVKKLMNLIKKGKVFGSLRCYMYSVEWQKRGLPHMHLLVWLEEHIRSTEVDTFISAELPNPDTDPVLFHIVQKNMVHGPCGQLNPSSPCMKDGKCTKGYPKALINETQTDRDGYPLYRRRKPGDGGYTAKVGRNEVDNRWVVPYCPLLSRIFNAHINVEFCNSVKSIKYICKYINKGSDQAVFGLNNDSDEITRFQMGRYISTNEAFWRIFKFDVHDRFPAVVHLSVHLENGQRVVFTPQNVVQRLEMPPQTTLTQFFRLCQTDAFASTLLYNELPRYYTWQPNKTWKRRVLGAIVEGHDDVVSDSALGRVYTVHPNNAECFYLRLLLHQVRGPTSFDVLRTVDGNICATYREACQQRGLLESDAHWQSTMQDAVLVHSAAQLRNLFAILITTCAPSNPVQLWHDFKEDMADDILVQAQRQNPDLMLECTADMHNEALVRLEEKVLAMTGKALRQWDALFPVPRRTATNVLSREMLRETSYNTEELTQYVAEMTPKLVPDQRAAFEEVMTAVASRSASLIFLNAPGGTGKTFLLNLLLAKLRSEQHIAIAVASSGIAATLLSGGRTAHSTFKLDLDLRRQESPVCNISKGTATAELLQKCVLIVWDECTMSHKAAFEALDRTLQDLRGNKQLMGGVALLLAGDFRQTLPVIPKGTPADELNACLKASYLWQHVKSITLQTNMRVHLQGDASAAQFANRLLNLGDGKPSVDECGQITFPDHFGNVVETMEQLRLSVYPNITSNFGNQEWLCQRAILAPKNDRVNDINTKIMKQLPGLETCYQSIDTVETEEAVDYPTEFLNSLEPPGMPPHNLFLKVGCPIMLLRNLDAPKLCNGTRLTVKQLLPHLIVATIITGCAKGEEVFLPRIPLIPTDLVLTFKRLQFPVRPAFAMTINKSQGQSLKVAGIDLQTPCFAHGQLYVACSRVGSPKNLFLLAPGGKTANVVYPQALQGML